MFTGIIEELGVVESIDKAREPALLTIKAKTVLDALKKGNSISVNGVCLTVTDVCGDGFIADVIKHTLLRTNLGELKQAEGVNLEKALSIGAEIGGHFVTGHVDGVGTIIRKEKEGGEAVIEFESAREILDGIVDKGSIAVDGISLTIAEIKPHSFSVYIIPYTAQVTTLGFKGTGEKVNLEVDILGKYVQKFLARQKPSNITEKFLKDKGFI